MKSDRQAARTVLSCWAVGFWGPVALWAGTEGDGAFVCAGLGVFTVFVDGEAGCEISAGGAATAVGAAAAGRDCITVWQAGDNWAALAFRQSNSSGLVGAIQEQCAAKSLSVQVCRTILS
jgi:hypothetical protein